MLPCLFNAYAEHVKQNAERDDLQAVVKIARRHINNLRYADDTTWLAESKGELKRLLMRVKEESEKAGLKLNIQKTKVTTSSPITSRQMKAVTDSLFLDSTVTANGDCSHEIRTRLLLGKKAMTNLDSVLKN